MLALDRVDFEVHRGEIVGYLGPNGSGKSTTVNLVVGLLEPSAGSITLDGRSLAADPVAYKRRIGYVPEEPHLYTHLTAAEYLELAIAEARSQGAHMATGFFLPMASAVKATLGDVDEAEADVCHSNFSFYTSPILFAVYFPVTIVRQPPLFKF